MLHGKETSAGVEAEGLKRQAALEGSSHTDISEDETGHFAA